MRFATLRPVGTGSRYYITSTIITIIAACRYGKVVIIIIIIVVTACRYGKYFYADGGAYEGRAGVAAGETARER